MEDEMIFKVTLDFPTPSLVCTPTNDVNVMSLVDKIEESELERLIDQSEFLPAIFLEEGAKVAKAVARIAFTKDGTLHYGTGFLVSPSLFITNNHVVPTREIAQTAIIQFNYQIDLEGNALPVEEFHYDNSFFYTSPESHLDFTIFKLDKNTQSISPGEKYGFISLKPNRIAQGQSCNIIQHPRARRKEVALHENRLETIFEKVIRYRTDTETGSSGSPVLDNSWKLIAIHHAGGERHANEFGDIIWINNEGIRIDKVIQDLKSKLTSISNGSQILTELGLNSPT